MKYSITRKPADDYKYQIKKVILWNILEQSYIKTNYLRSVCTLLI